MRGHPLAGVSFLIEEVENERLPTELVSVPLSGLSFLMRVKPLVSDMYIRFRPLIGVIISNALNTLESKWGDLCFRPLIGVIISNFWMTQRKKDQVHIVSVPLSGLSFLIGIQKGWHFRGRTVSVPLSGLSFLILAAQERALRKYCCFRPLIGVIISN